MLKEQFDKFEKVLKETLEKKEVYEKNISELEKILTYLKSDFSIKENDSVETIILKTYIELGSIKNTSDYINTLGYRIPSATGERKYTVKDISNLIPPIDSDIKVDKRLQEIVTEIYTYRSNSKYGNLLVKEY